MLMLVGSCSPAVSFLWEVQCPALDTVPAEEGQPPVEGKAYFIRFAVFVPADTYNSLVAFVFRNVMLLHPL